MVKKKLMKILIVLDTATKEMVQEPLLAVRLPLVQLVHCCDLYSIFSYRQITKTAQVKVEEVPLGLQISSLI